MIGFNSSEAGHVVPLISPISLGAATAAQRFSMKSYDHVSIIIMIGLESGVPGAVTIKQYAAATGGSGTAMAFRYYKCETTVSGDVLVGPTSATSTGFAPAAQAGTLYIIEMDSPELEDTTLPYLELNLSTGASSCLISAVAILSAGRQQFQGSPTQLT